MFRNFIEWMSEGASNYSFPQMNHFAWKVYSFIRFESLNDIYEKSQHMHTYTRQPFYRMDQKPDKNQRPIIHCATFPCKTVDLNYLKDIYVLSIQCSSSEDHETSVNMSEFCWIFYQLFWYCFFGCLELINEFDTKHLKSNAITIPMIIFMHPISGVM